MKKKSLKKAREFNNNVVSKPINYRINIHKRCFIVKCKPCPYFIHLLYFCGDYYEMNYDHVNSDKVNTRDIFFYNVAQYFKYGAKHCKNKIREKFLFFCKFLHSA